MLQFVDASLRQIRDLNEKVAGVTADCDQLRKALAVARDERDVLTQRVKEASAKPMFSEDKIDQTIDMLESLKVVPSGDRDTVKRAFTENPDSVLDFIFSVSGGNAGGAAVNRENLNYNAGASKPDGYGPWRKLLT